MKKLEAITILDNEKFLRQISKPVIFPDKNLKKDIKILEEYFKQTDIALAMAAVQLKIPKRIIYLKNTDLKLVEKNKNQLSEEEKSHNERRILINPVILSRVGLTDYWEACASCLDNTGHVKRPYKITVQYQDINGHFHTEIFEGFESTVLSHEMDHLDGILHMDIAEEVLVMNYEERKEFRKTHKYNILSKRGKYEDLIKKSKKSK